MAEEKRTEVKEKQEKPKTTRKKPVKGPKVVN